MMKLAEALQERADLNCKIDELRNRLQHNALVQEGEEPAEAPEELLTELDFSIDRLEELIFPRLAALAENAWSLSKDYEDFLRRLPAWYRLWEADGVAVYDWEKSVHPTAFQGARALLQQLRRWMFNSPAETVNARLLEQAERLSAHPEQASRNPIFSPTFTSEEQQAIGREFVRLVHQEVD